MNHKSSFTLQSNLNNNKNNNNHNTGNNGEDKNTLYIYRPNEDKSFTKPSTSEITQKQDVKNQIDLLNQNKKRILPKIEKNQNKRRKNSTVIKIEKDEEDDFITYCRTLTKDYNKLDPARKRRYKMKMMETMDRLLSEQI